MKKKLTTKRKPDIELIQTALDTLGLALIDHKHEWTPKEKRLYNRACAELRRLRIENMDVSGLMNIINNANPTYTVKSEVEKK